MEGRGLVSERSNVETVKRKPKILVQSRNSVVYNHSIALNNDMNQLHMQ